MIQTLQRTVLYGLIFGFTALLSAVERREIGNVILEGIPELPAHHAERLQPYLETRSAGLADWRPDGNGILIRTRFGELAQVHEVRMPGGARHQLTFFPEPPANVAARPADHGSFLFTRDTGGNEQFQVYYFERETGRATLLSDGRSRNGSPVWDRGGERIAFSSTARNGRDWDIYIVEADDPDSRRRVFESSGFYSPVEFSPNGNELLLYEAISVTESYLHLLDLQSGKTQRLDSEPAENAETVGYGSVTWAADGNSLFLVSDRDSEFRQLRILDLETGEQTLITGHIAWNVENIELSPDGSMLAFSVNEDGLSRLHFFDIEASRILDGAEIPVGILGRMRWHPDDSSLAFTLNTPRSPSDVFVLDAPAGDLVQWTHSEVGGLDTDRFVIPELVHFPTFDEVDGAPRQISAWVYRPAGEGPHPVLVSIHGGPAAQFRPYFSPLWQFLANEMGVAVVAPNVRGSTGYGRTFVSLDDGFLREDSVRDIGALLDWIDDAGFLDSKRVVTMGGSYGGYMVYASHIHFGDRLTGGISSVGISNFVTFLENTADYRRDLRRVEYGDESDPEMRAFLESISPLTHAERIRKPMLIAQGANDPRVPLSEAEQMVERIRTQGAEPWYFLALDEGHGFRRKSNSDLYRLVTIAFIEKTLGLDTESDQNAEAEDAG